ncbi:MAG: E3 ubiquitin ligase family protein [Crocinitomicaceae bacterium]
MGIIIIGVVLAVIGVILWVVKGKKESKSIHLELTDTSTVGEVLENYNSLSPTVGDGNFTHFCELKGKAHADSPIQSSLSEIECVYYSSKVIRKYEEREWKTDSEGKRQQHWQKKSDVVSENKQWANNFGIKDETGFVEVDPAKAELHSEKVHSSFEKGEPSLGSALSAIVGKFSLGSGTVDGNDYRLIGYEKVEHAIKQGENLYVLGDANDRDGSLRVSKPNTNKPFIISTKSEDELVSNLGSSVKRLKISAYIFWGLGAIAVIVGILKTLQII